MFVFQVLLPFRFSNQKFCMYFTSFMRATCHSYLICDLITLITFGEAPQYLLFSACVYSCYSCYFQVLFCPAVRSCMCWIADGLESFYRPSVDLSCI
jgi:hypothetical protein